MTTAERRLNADVNRSNSRTNLQSTPVEIDFYQAVEENSDTDMDMSTESEGDVVVVGSPTAIPVLDISDFDCSLCSQLFYLPISTTCGHTFCKNCFLSSLKYSPNCPLCRTKLFESSKRCNYSVNYLLVSLLEKHFLVEYKAREMEEKQLQQQQQPLEEDIKDNEEVEPPSCSWWDSCATLGCVLLYPN
eukprot:TRINITY_DN466_c0_g2_i1.p1 TRINITY_DN466_c0_g2~~TRINITY_DN466_c0_g2_i1.p1  ORF type:complete len:189 (-),score=19.56 TRINITY_DN466_c0_g2_i1:26-592(-)